ncbi:hypothetical protein TDB9533_03330 [Thalassocella blandensis]|nr:hypothetical protein TDB9533_03330 [Thalassocella blandensis]
MKIDVYDSYATREDGRTLHFDVFVKEGTSPETALHHGRQWLNSIGEDSAGLKQLRCNFCHSEIASPKVRTAVEAGGFFILQLEGCPSPVQKI